MLSILPLDYAVKQATRIIKAMKTMNVYPNYVDCNAISPSTNKEVADFFDRLATNFGDGGIIWPNPPKEAGLTHLYVSGVDTGLVRQLDSRGMVVRDLSPEMGRASAMKVVYARSTKGAFSLFAAVGLMT